MVHACYGRAVSDSLAVQELSDLVPVIVAFQCPRAASEESRMTFSC